MLSVYIFKTHQDINRSSIIQRYTEQISLWFTTEDMEYPKDIVFEPFYKDLIRVVMEGENVHVFISNDITQKDLGRVEHCFYTYANVRGVGHFIDKLEFLCTPSTPLKKFLMKRC